MGIKSSLILALILLAAVFLFSSISISRAQDTTGVPEGNFKATETTNTPNKAEQQEHQDSTKKYQFQAEVNKLLGIIINSLYTNKEIFLRELISNASDALDKIRFLALTNPDLLGNTPQLEIRISANKEERTLTIKDTGVGMTKDDLVNNLGTIAKSGTKNFVEKLNEGADLNLIGQFGVGFYSIFLIADRAVVSSKHNDDAQWVWDSTADGTFSVYQDSRNNLGRGTEITLHLKEDADEFLEDETLKRLVARYSEFIHFPIYLYTTTVVEKEVPIEEEPEEPATEEEKKESTTEEEKKDSDEVEVDKEDSEEEEEEDESEEEEKPKTKTVKETVNNWDQLNQNKPIWTRDPKTIENEEYYNFYKTFTKETDNPLTYTHFNTEGDVAFKSILFVPGHGPNSAFDMTANPRTIRLYVRRVFITDDFQDMMPRYLNFIRGIVDSDDLPLNVSREILQQSSLLNKIKKKLVKKAIEMFKKLSDEDEEEKQKSKEEGTQPKESDFDKFWKEYGKAIRLGVIEDRTNRDRLANLLRFPSTKSNGTLISLQSYVKRMGENDKNIYFITGESIESVEKSPFLEKAKELGREVIYMVDAIDEYTSQHLTEFEGKKFINIARDGASFGDESDAEKEKEKKTAAEFEPLTKFLKKTLADKIERVQISKLLSSSPCILVAPQNGPSANMERIFKAQALGSDNNQYRNLKSKKIMDINPSHPIIKDLNTRVSSDDDLTTAKDIAYLLYDTAMLQSGYSLDDPSTFAARIHRMLKYKSTVEEEETTQQQEEQKQESTKQEEKVERDEL